MASIRGLQRSVTPKGVFTKVLLVVTLSGCGSASRQALSPGTAPSSSTTTTAQKTLDRPPTDTTGPTRKLATPSASSTTPTVVTSATTATELLAQAEEALARKDTYRVTQSDRKGILAARRLVLDVDIQRDVVAIIPEPTSESGFRMCVGIKSYIASPEGWVRFRQADKPCSEADPIRHALRFYLGSTAQLVPSDKPGLRAVKVNAYGDPTLWFDEDGTVRLLQTDLVTMEIERFGVPVEFSEPTELLVDSEARTLKFGSSKQTNDLG
jgi:hypothetical protein